MAQGNGRDHHLAGFSIWLAGGGVKGGITYGATDELGYNAVEDKVHVNDLHATMLHLLGIDHKQLTYRFQGRDFRLTDVAGRSIRPILRLSRSGRAFRIPGLDSHTTTPQPARSLVMDPFRFRPIVTGLRTASPRPSPPRKYSPRSMWPGSRTSASPRCSAASTSLGTPPPDSSSPPTSPAWPSSTAPPSRTWPSS